MCFATHIQIHTPGGYSLCAMSLEPRTLLALMLLGELGVCVFSSSSSSLCTRFIGPRNGPPLSGCFAVTDYSLINVL